MTDSDHASEENTGLLDSVRKANSAWFEAVERSTAEMGSQDLLILVWGPGKTTSTQNFDKRMQIVEHLRSLSSHNHVVTSELLDEEQPELLEAFPDIFDREEYHARIADVVLMLLISPQQTGVQTEIVLLKRDPRLTAKAQLFMPSDWDKDNLLAQAVNNFPEAQTTRLTMAQIRDCHIIRSSCERHLNQLRAQRFLDKLRLERY
jgi:hypothetical protein